MIFITSFFDSFSASYFYRALLYLFVGLISLGTLNAVASDNDPCGRSLIKFTEEGRALQGALFVWGDFSALRERGDVTPLGGDFYKVSALGLRSLVLTVPPVVVREENDERVPFSPKPNPQSLFKTGAVHSLLNLIRGVRVPAIKRLDQPLSFSIRKTLAQAVAGEVSTGLYPEGLTEAPNLAVGDTGVMVSLFHDAINAEDYLASIEPLNRYGRFEVESVEMINDRVVQQVSDLWFLSTILGFQFDASSWITDGSTVVGSRLYKPILTPRGIIPGRSGGVFGNFSDNPFFRGVTSWPFDQVGGAGYREFEVLLSKVSTDVEVYIGARRTDDIVTMLSQEGYTYSEVEVAQLRERVQSGREALRTLRRAHRQ